MNIRFRTARIIKAVSGVDLSIAPGEIHALVGESGAGKTTVGSALMGLLQEPGRIAAGRIEIGGQAVDIRTGRTRGIVQGRDVGAIFQDPMTSLNPLFTVESQLCETMRYHLRIARRRSARAGARASEGGWNSGAGAAARGLSASAIRRTAAARRHRRGALLRSQAPRR